MRPMAHHTSAPRGLSARKPGRARLVGVNHSLHFVAYGIAHRGHLGHVPGYRVRAQAQLDELKIFLLLLEKENLQTRFSGVPISARLAYARTRSV
jgi:hypothetical protein